MAHLVRPWIVTYTLDGRRVPKGTPGAKRNRERAAKWYGQGIPGLPKKKRVPLSANKAVAKKELQRMVDDAERSASGLPDLTQKTRPVLDHLADFRAYLESKPDRPSDAQINQKIGRVTRFIDASGVNFIAEITAEKVGAFLSGLRKCPREVPALPKDRDEFTKKELAVYFSVEPNSITSAVRRNRLAATGEGKKRRFPRATAEAIRGLVARGCGVQTANHYLTEVRSFTRWLAGNGRLHRDPLAGMKPGKVATDRRHDRRELMGAELVRILDAARASTEPVRGLGGLDRFMLYLTACATGYRVSELAALVPASFHLDGEPPTVRLPARATKNRKGAEQPINRAVAEQLRTYLSGKPLGKPVWPGTWHERAAEMLRADLDAAGVPYVVEGPDGPLFADFHAMRHTYISAIARVATVVETQRLARHSDPRLTIGRYSHAQLPELGRAVERLPALAPDTSAHPPAAAANGQAVEEQPRLALRA